jgi:TetR/AcrR family transcriptional repressor of nem operon
MVPVARPREFDPEKVLNQAMRVFWEQGYRATSLDDLMGATKLNKQSLYCAFGNKRSLFLKALELYRNQKLPAVRRKLEEFSSPFEAVEAVVRSAADREAKGDCPLGCLMTNTALELGLTDSEIAGEVKKMLRGFDGILNGVIRKGQEKGEITRRFESGVIAQSLGNTLNGIGVLEKTGASRRQVKAIVDMAIEAIRA